MNKSTVISFLFLLLNVYAAFGNINSIDLKKIENGEKYSSYFSYVKDNQSYYDHWSPEWKYDQKKRADLKKVFAS